jgi:hypothetical protein
MNYCGFKDEIQKGFLFFLGAAINIGINKSSIDLSKHMANAELQRASFLKIINAYSQTSGNISDYGDLNVDVFSKSIYTYNVILFKLSGVDPNEIDKQLRSFEINKSHSSILLKTDIDTELEEKYANSAFNLNICHNLFEDIIFVIGNHLHKSGYDLQRSYGAGYAYFCLQTTFDTNGTTFLFSTIIDSLTPLYKALFSYPILNFAYQDSLKKNHIFSNTLQMFYAGIDPEIIQPIHRYHQLVFYSPNSYSLRSQWDFESRKDSEKQAFVFLNALAIRNTDILNIKDDYLAFDDLMFPELKNVVINRDLLYQKIQKGIFEKYGILPVGADPNVWNNLGDLIQYFCVLFYETCLHAIVIEDLKIDK